MKYLIQLNEDRPDISPRDGFGEALLELGEKNKDVVVVTADVAESVRAYEFGQKYPNRFFDVGVAEQNMAGVSAGLALAGKVPYMVGYGVFSPGRNWDQIRVSICYSDANVKIIASHTGLNVGPDGATHQALEDIALMRVLPNMTVIVPADKEQVKQATLALAKHNGPAYLRFGREKAPVIIPEEADFKIGQAQHLIAGNDVTIIACGAMVASAVEVAEKLEGEISVGVINCHTIKPLDEATILAAAKHTGLVITAEEHQVFGGLGSAISELLGERLPTKVIKFGVYDQFGRSGQAEELLKRYHLTAEDLQLTVIKAVKNKS